MDLQIISKILTSGWTFFLKIKAWAWHIKHGLLNKNETRHKLILLKF